MIHRAPPQRQVLADPQTYNAKLDVFSCGVLFVQWPNPGPRTYTVQVGNDPCFPSGRGLVEVPEYERRKEHLDLISPTHPLLEVALLISCNVLPILLPQCIQEAAHEGLCDNEDIPLAQVYPDAGPKVCCTHTHTHTHTH